MSIKDLLEKIKPFYMLFLGIVLAIIFFALGRLSAIEERHRPIKIEYGNQPSSQLQTSSAIQTFSLSTTSPRQARQDLTQTVQAVKPVSTSGQVIGSKSGKKYYFPWCSTVKRIKPENQVHFASADLARAAGFVAGGNCKGLK